MDPNGQSVTMSQYNQLIPNNHFMVPNNLFIQITNSLLINIHQTVMATASATQYQLLSDSIKNQTTTHKDQ